MLCLEMLKTFMRFPEKPAAIIQFPPVFVLKGKK